MPARTAASDAEAIGIHPIPGGIMPDEAHRTVDVGHDLRDHELRLGTMHHGKNGIAALQQGLEVIRVDKLMRRDPAAADHVKNPHPIGRLRLNNIQREGGAKFAPVDDIFGTGEVIIRLSADTGPEQQQAGAQHIFHGMHRGNLTAAFAGSKHPHYAPAPARKALRRQRESLTR